MTCNVDPVGLVIDYVNAIKPFHSKIYEASVSQKVTDAVALVVEDTHYLDIAFNIDYHSDYCPHYGWDQSEWEGVWLAGDTVDFPILEIDPVGRTVSFMGDVTPSVYRNAYFFGHTDVSVSSFVPSTGIFSMTRSVPWTTGTAVQISGEQLVPLPLTSGATVFAIRITDTTFKLAATSADALSDTPIAFVSHAAGKLVIKSVHHEMVIHRPVPRTVTVIGAEYDRATNRTVVELLANDFVGLIGGFVKLYVESNWDRPDSCSDPETGNPLASFTTVRLAIDETIEFDFPDYSVSDLVGVGRQSTATPWGGDDGIIRLNAYRRDLTTQSFRLLGDWRYHVTSSLHSHGNITINTTFPARTIVIEAYRVFVDPDVYKVVTEFRVTDPTDLLGLTQSTIFDMNTNTPYWYPDVLPLRADESLVWQVPGNSQSSLSFSITNPDGSTITGAWTATDHVIDIEELEWDLVDDVADEDEDWGSIDQQHQENPEDDWEASFVEVYSKGQIVQSYIPKYMWDSPNYGESPDNTTDTFIHESMTIEFGDTTEPMHATWDGANGWSTTPWNN